MSQMWEASRFDEEAAHCRRPFGGCITHSQGVISEYIAPYNARGCLADQTSSVLKSKDLEATACMDSQQRVLEVTRCIA